jgi:Nucleotidyltransferase domain
MMHGRQFKVQTLIIRIHVRRLLYLYYLFQWNQNNLHVFLAMSYHWKTDSLTSYGSRSRSGRSGSTSSRRIESEEVTTVTQILASTSLTEARGDSQRGQQRHGRKRSSATSVLEREGAVNTYGRGILDRITPTQTEFLAKQDECRRLEGILQRIVPGASLKIVGGTANTFGLKNSDVDVCIVVGAFTEFERYKAEEFEEKLARCGMWLLRLYLYFPGYKTELLLHTFVPVLRVSGGPAGSNLFELSWDNSIGIYKTELLVAYSAIDPRVKNLARFVKHWAKARALTNTRLGGMGSFAWSLTCIYFLIKVTQPAVLPNLQANSSSSPEYAKGCNVAFDKSPSTTFKSTNSKVGYLKPVCTLLSDRR